MFYHGNIKIRKAKFNQGWESEIIPRVEAETCGHSVWDSTASTALSEEDKGSRELSGPRPRGSPPRGRPWLRFVTVLYRDGEQLWLWLVAQTLFFFSDDKTRHSSGSPVGFFVKNVDSAKLQGTDLSTEGNSFTWGDSPEPQANPCHRWHLWF